MEFKFIREKWNKMKSWRFVGGFIAGMNTAVLLVIVLGLII